MYLTIHEAYYALRLIQQGKITEVIKRDPVVTVDTGLCSNILGRLYGDTDLVWSIKEHIKTWSKYSNCITYPVKNELKRNAEICHTYDYYLFGNRSMYNRRTRYGRDRCELAGYIADFLQPMIEG